MYFEAFLSRSSRDGNHCGRHLFHDIEQRGDTGSFSNLERLLASWRRAERPGKDSASPASIIRVNQSATLSHTNPATCRVISPVVAPALCTKPRDVLMINQATKVDVLKQGSHEFATMRRLAMRFRGILRGL